MSTISQRKQIERVAVLIPAYCEEDSVVGVVTEALKYLPDVIGNVNGGKGAALIEGFQYVLEQGFDAVIALDADGFHDPNQIPKFIETYYRCHLPVLIGNRMAEPETVPVIRRWSIRLMSSWLNRFMGVYVPDPPCGFRFYRCDVLPFLLENGSALPAEFETLLHIASRRIRVGSVRIAKKAGCHKRWISPFRDIVRFVRVLYRHYSKIRRERRAALSVRDDEG